MSKPETLVERMRLLLCTANGADVHFLVGEDDEKQHISAHKAILASASDVFEAMFRFDAAKVPCPVVVPDVEPEAFHAMLAFIYTDNLDGMDGDNLFSVLYTAKKYNVVGLVSACVAFPIPKLPNVFFAFAQARFLGEDDFACRCMEFIEQNLDTLSQSDAFLQIDQTLLCEILDRETLAIGEELTIWNLALSWADGQCRQKGVECSAENRRKMLGSALYKIRFPRIPKAHFTESVVPSGVLSSDELVSVLLCYAHPRGGVPALYPLPFPTHRLGYALSGRLTLNFGNLFGCTFPEERDEQIRECIRRFGDSVLLRGLPCKFCSVVLIRQYVQRMRLDIFLHANIKSDVQTWNCTCTAIRKIPSRKEGKKDYVHESVIGVINSASNGGRFHHYMPFDGRIVAHNHFYVERNSEVYKAEDEELTLVFDVSTP